MSINFNLVSPTKKTSSIRMVVTHSGQVFRKSIGVSCVTASWSAKKQRSSNVHVQDEVRRILLRVESKLTWQTPAEQVPSILDWAIGRDDEFVKPVEGSGFWDVFESVATRPDLKRNTRLTWEFCLTTMRKFIPEDVKWSDFSEDFIQDIVDEMLALGYCESSVKQYTAKTKHIFKIGARRGYHCVREFEWPTIREHDADTVSLTQEEVDILEAMPLKGGKAKARDLFLLGVYTAARYSDIKEFSMKNIMKDRFQYVQRKTGMKVLIPLNPKVKRILQDNGGHSPKYEHAAYNHMLKDLCREAGFDTPVIVRRDRMNRTRAAYPGTKEIVKQKWQLVTSHTARRTACTLLYKSGVPTRVCMYLSGHTTEDSFAKYIRIDREEHADILARSPFFK